MRQTIIILLMMISATIGATATKPGMIIPKPLHRGSRIAIVTPASAIDDHKIDVAVEKLKAHGYEPVVYPHAYGRAYGSYAAADSIRAAELMKAFSDTTIDAILCSRGGYGTVRLLPMLDAEIVRNNPKWLIGYSDISDLHAFMYHAGVASIHGPMAGHLASEPDDLEATQLLYRVLDQGLPLQITLPADPRNRHGMAKGRLVGGNLLTINGLAQTPYDVMYPAEGEDLILFIEDVSEQIYAIERVLMRMHQSGALGRLKGLIIGQFTEYHPSQDFKSMEQMIHHWLKEWGYYEESSPMPIVFNYPTGHVSDNYPMVVGSMVRMTVSPQSTVLRFTDD